MGELGGFLRVERDGMVFRPPEERVGDVHEFQRPLPDKALREQGARCMECGVPFCHDACPVGNLIPDWNDLVYGERWRDAIVQLHATNNFPDFTGRLCPAPCEPACVLEIREGQSVTIKQIELAIVERAWSEGWIAPQPPAHRTGHTVAVIGSGPAGLACAQQLRRAGHDVVVFERDEAPGGFLRFGVPDFKIEKRFVERRVAQLQAEGVELRCGVDVGRDLHADQLLAEHDAVVVATGSRVPRDLPVPGRGLDGVHVAMDYLYERNRAIAASPEGAGAWVVPPPLRGITAAGKDVVVIGGGDTGADCVGNAHREGARSVTQLELLPEPPATRDDEHTPWPQWPLKLRRPYALEEGGERHFAMGTLALRGDGVVQTLEAARVGPPPTFVPVPDSAVELPAQLVLVAIGFTGPEREGLVEQLRLPLDARGTIRAGAYRTPVDGVFVAGDARRGQSLIVWAINEGRQCARVVDRHLRELAPQRAGVDRRAA